ncbi:DUF2948 family protein [Paracoccus sp. S-4012]|uniref:DUF2948 family protein n=1 Tax=Paracoccus sp. S-4012 TaxID=2665648 RepID=UPI0012AF62E6|nr:DUF2948 family protein [Paracoccus sp. S-4012]MRX50447.1 DUF2948 family protein [Paracoccus sp. S-4012]
MADARFMDAEPAPLRLRAEDADDLAVISALTQDAVVSVGDISWDAKARRLALLLNRFRWEDAEAAHRDGRPFERVRALLVLSDVLRVAGDGIDREDRDLILSLLALDWQAGEDGTGTLTLTFAGDGAIAASVECLSAELRDVTRPYAAPSGRAPSHPE